MRVFGNNSKNDQKFQHTLFAVVAVVDSGAAAAAVALGPEVVRIVGAVMEDDTAAEIVQVSVCAFSTFIWPLKYRVAHLVSQKFPLTLF